MKDLRDLKDLTIHDVMTTREAVAPLLAGGGRGGEIPGGGVDTSRGGVGGRRGEIPETKHFVRVASCVTSNALSVSLSLWRGGREGGEGRYQVSGSCFVVGCGWCGAWTTVCSSPHICEQPLVAYRLYIVYRQVF